MFVDVASTAHQSLPCHGIKKAGPKKCLMTWQARSVPTRVVGARPHGVGVALQLGHLAAREDVPHARRAVARRGGQPRAVGQGLSLLHLKHQPESLCVIVILKAPSVSHTLSLR